MPYRIHRAGGTAEAVEAAQAAMGSADNPVVEVVVDASNGTITVSFADGTTRTDTLPAGMGGAGLDQDARDAAGAAQATADSAESRSESNAAKLMPPSSAEATNGTATTIRGWTAALIRRLVEGAVPIWARDATTPLPAAKVSATLRGTRVYVTTDQPSAGQIGDIWLQDLTGTHPIIYEFTETGWQADYSFFGGRVHFTSGDFNIAMDTPSANGGDLNFNVVPGNPDSVWRLYRRNATTTVPFWDLIGPIATGGGTSSVEDRVAALESAPSGGQTFVALGSAGVSVTRGTFTVDSAVRDAVIGAVRARTYSYLQIEIRVDPATGSRDRWPYWVPTHDLPDDDRTTRVHFELPNAIVAGDDAEFRFNISTRFLTTGNISFSSSEPGFLFPVGSAVHFFGVA